MNKFLKHLKKAAAGVLALFVVMTGMQTAGAFNDLKGYSSNIEVISAIDFVADRGIMVGSTSGNFLPEENVTRTQMAIILVRVLKLDTTKVPAKASFKDVPTNHWAFKYIEAAKTAGLIKGGSNGYFNVNGICTRQEMAAMFVRALGLTEEQLAANQDLFSLDGMADKAKVASWFKQDVEFVLRSGLMNGTGNNNFSPDKPTKRIQVALIVHRFMGANNLDTLVAQYAANGYPELFEALNELYTAENQYESSSEMDLETIYNYGGRDQLTFASGLDMTGKVNGKDYDVEITSRFAVLKDIFKEEIPEYPAQVDNYHIIHKNNVVYTKYSDEDVWYSYTTENAEPLSLGLLELIGDRRELLVEKTANVQMNGVSTSKYSFTVKAVPEWDELYALIAFGHATEEDLNIILGEGLDTTVEIYMNEQNQIVAERFTFNTSIPGETSEDTAEVNFALQYNYSNIGEAGTITAPPSDKVVPVEEDVLNTDTL